ncbi:MAG: hypothetical protein ACRD0P_33200, partial [Stackebrandtia sp.]
AMTYTIRYNRATNHIEGITERTTARESRDHGVVGYYAVTACPALSRTGIQLAYGQTIDSLADAVRDAEFGERRLCTACRKAADAELADQAPGVDESGGVESADDGELWNSARIAAYLGISEASVTKWIQRRVERLPVAEYGTSANGRPEKLRRAADVQREHESMPGKGNRTPRKPKAAPKPEPVVKTVTVDIPDSVWVCVADSQFPLDEPEIWKRLDVGGVSKGAGYRTTASVPDFEEFRFYVESVVDVCSMMSSEESGADEESLLRDAKEFLAQYVIAREASEPKALRRATPNAIRTDANSHWLQGNGTVCNPNRLPKGELYVAGHRWDENGHPTGLSPVVCNRCNKVNPYGR